MNMRTRLALTLAAVAATAALPARAAVIQTASIPLDLGDDLLFNPARPNYGLTFDVSFGTLNAVTLSFDGDVGISAEAFIIGPAPYSTEFTTDVSVTYGGLYGVSLGTLAAPIIVTEIGPGTLYGKASASAPQRFDLTVPAVDYENYNVYMEFRFGDNQFAGYTTPPGPYFKGSVSALFDYTPFAQSISEPASLALFGIGVALSASPTSLRGIAGGRRSWHDDAPLKAPVHLWRALSCRSFP